MGCFSTCLLSHYAWLSFQDDDHPSSNGSAVGSDDEWETASGESSDEELSMEIIENSSARAENTTSDDAAENVDREALQQRAHNRIHEISSNSANPRECILTDSIFNTVCRRTKKPSYRWRQVS